jgi:hypothetical protein
MPHFEFGRIKLVLKMGRASKFGAVYPCFHSTLLLNLCALAGYDRLQNLSLSVNLQFLNALTKKALMSRTTPCIRITKRFLDGVGGVTRCRNMKNSAPLVLRIYRDERIIISLYFPEPKSVTKPQTTVLKTNRRHSNGHI